MVESVVREQRDLGLLETCGVLQVGRSRADRSKHRHNRMHDEAPYLTGAM